MGELFYSAGTVLYWGNCFIVGELFYSGGTVL